MNRDRQQNVTPGTSRNTMAVLILAIIVSDATLRFTEDSLSGNIEHVNEISGISKKLHSAQQDSMLFLGNSLTNNGVDSQLTRRLLAKSEIDIGPIGKIVPDATSIWSWSCIMDNHFFYQGQNPDIVILGFGWNQLSDQSRVLPTRLGAFFCSLKDLPKIDRYGDLTFSEYGEFFFARIFRTYAHRETIRNRFLSSIIPNYEGETQTNNRRLRNDDSSPANAEFSYRVLGSLIDDLDSRSSRLIVMAMPVRDRPYENNQKLMEFLKSRNVLYLDYRRLPEINAQSFLDDMHLNEQGATVLTSKLASDLADTLFSDQ